jgi:hypothetical protein
VYDSMQSVSLASVLHAHVLNFTPQYLMRVHLVRLLVQVKIPGLQQAMPTPPAIKVCQTRATV